VKTPLCTLVALLLVAAFTVPAAAQVRRINAPHFPSGIRPAETAVFWFGRLDSSQNHVDVRVGYSDQELWIRLSVFDQWLWYDDTPAATDLHDWDAVTLTIHTDEEAAAAPSTNSFRLVGQLSGGQSRMNYQAAYVGNGVAWTATTLTGFATEVGWRGEGLNDSTADRGWLLTFRIPFAAVGVPAPPAPGTTWRLGVQLHDRDSSTGPGTSAMVWPEAMSVHAPASWAQLGFGLRTNPDITPQPGADIVTIRQDVATPVPDAMVGGGSSCAEGTDFFQQWGGLSYAGSPTLVVQNQGDVADWPCFSRLYVDFPLGAVPRSKEVVSATLTLHQFGGSDPSRALRSLIQVSTVADAWNESTITWNTAPLASENVAQNWVDVVNGPPWPNVARTWNVSSAATQAYQEGQPVLRLVLYSADGAYHSGKYFRSSDADDGIAWTRPTLQVIVQEVTGAPRPPSNLRIAP
jgi:hypothetical protein